MKAPKPIQTGQDAPAIASVAPNVRVAYVERAGHSAYFEQAAPFNQAIDQFLGATASASTGAR